MLVRSSWEVAIVSQIVWTPYSLASLMSRISTMHSFMHAISLKYATSNASMSVSVYFDSWALNRLFLSETSGHNDDLVIPCTVSVCFPFDRLLPISIKCDVTPIKMLFTLKYTFYKKSMSQVSKMCHYIHDGFPSATTRAWPPTTNHEVPSILRVRTSEMTGLFPPGAKAQVQIFTLLRLQSETVNCKKEPIYWVLGMFFFVWFPQFLLLSSMCHLATPRCDLDQPGWICRLIPFVEAQWLSGRMPDSRSRGHRHESSKHICAVDDDKLWRCYATTKYNHCIPLYLYVAINYDLFIFIYNTVAPLKLLNDFHRKLIYLCKIYDSPPGIVGMIILMKNMGPFAHTNTNFKCHLSSPPKVKVWISAFVLFQKVDICSRNVSIVKSSSFSVVVSKWARLTRRRLRPSSCSWR